MAGTAAQRARAAAVRVDGPPAGDLLAGQGLQFVNIKAWMLASRSHRGLGGQGNRSRATNPGGCAATSSAAMVAFAFSSNFVYALIGSLLRRWLSQAFRLLWFNRALAQCWWPPLWMVTRT